MSAACPIRAGFKNIIDFEWLYRPQQF